jgi:hypothetical protein
MFWRLQVDEQMVKKSMQIGGTRARMPCKGGDIEYKVRTRYALHDLSASKVNVKTREPSKLHRQEFDDSIL